MKHAVDRFNRRHPWSHNDHHGRWVARRILASTPREVLDVGCGAGDLVARLRAAGTAVTGLEPDPTVAAVARSRFRGDDRVRLIEATFAGRTRDRRWPAITLVAVLHHLPLVSTLRELRAALAPGGRLVVLGCHRRADPLDPVETALEIGSTIANPLVGAVRHPIPADELPVAMRAPTASPRETFAEIRSVVRRELPGARMHRRTFWRYGLVYDAPG